MSIATSLTKLSSDISDAYDAINTMGGTIPSDKNTDNLPSAISSIPQGGGSVILPEEKNINFYDYDGTLLYGYTKAEYQELTELPALPTHTGLEADSWSYTKSEIDTKIIDRNISGCDEMPISVGAMYKNTTSEYNNIIKIHMIITNEYNTPYIEFTCANATIYVDWGDGNTETVTTSSNNFSAHHTYSTSGEYTIVIETNSALTIVTNWNAHYTFISDGIDHTEQQGKSMAYRNNVKMLEIYGSSTNKITLGNGALAFLTGLEKIIIGKNVVIDANITRGIFEDDYALKAIVINWYGASGEVDLFGETFMNCYSLETVIFTITSSTGRSVYDIRTRAFQYCRSLKNLEIHGYRNFRYGESYFEYCTSLEYLYIRFGSLGNAGTSANAKTAIFKDCYNLKKVSFDNGTSGIVGYQYAQNNFTNCYSLREFSEIDSPNSRNYIANKSFYNCYALEKVKFCRSSSCTIAYDAFKYCYSLKTLDFSLTYTIPTLSTSGTTIFADLPSDYQIIVPDSLYSSWITTANWSDVASHIVSAGS